MGLAEGINDDTYLVVFMFRIVFLDVTLPVDEEVEYYQCSDFPFNFDFIYNVRSPVQASDVAVVINNWASKVPNDKPNNWVVRVTIIFFKKEKVLTIFQRY